MKLFTAIKSEKIYKKVEDEADKNAVIQYGENGEIKKIVTYRKRTDEEQANKNYLDDFKKKTKKIAIGTGIVLAVSGGVAVYLITKNKKVAVETVKEVAQVIV